VSVTVRIGREYFAQLVGMAVLLVDRVVLTGILLRAWGVDAFAQWSVAMAAAGMVAFFDFGLNLYFSNRLTFSVERGKLRRAQHAYRAGNLLVTLAALTATLVICGSFWIFGDHFIDGDVTITLWLAVAALVVAAASRYALAAHYYLYRAHRQFERQTYIIAATDLARVVAAGIAVLLGGGLIEAAGAYLAGALLSSYPLALLDARRRFPSFRFGMEIPNRAERRVIPPVALGFWAQSVPVTILTFVPVFVLAALGSPGAVIARFVLIRTLGNLARMAPQLIGTVLGQEAGRRFGRGERESMFVVYREGCKILAAQSAGLTGVIVALAQPVFQAWTSKAELYNAPMLWLALAPLALGPSMVLANAVFGHANRPRDMVTGRLAQLVLTLFSFLFLPLQDSALRMMAALAIGEILGFGIPAFIGVRRLLPAAGASFMLDLLGRSMIAGLICYGAALAGYSLPGPALLSLGLGCLAGGAAILLMSFLVGIEPQRRTVLLTAAKRLA
jgi:hypothetical protein